MSCTNLIVDGSNLEFRSFWASMQNVKNPEEDISTYEKNSCTKQFMLSLKKIVKKASPDNVYVCWDKKLTHPSKNFRDELLGDYKGTRKKTSYVQLMYDQEPRTIELLKSLGCKCLFPNILEGDDVVAWLTHTLSGSNAVVSVDNDMYQLVNERTVVMHPSSHQIINSLNFEEIVGIKKDCFILYKAIKGDDSDNIIGLPGYGKAKGKRLAESWNPDHVTDEYKQIVERNIKVIDLSVGYKVHPEEVPVYERQLNEQENQPFNIKKFTELCKEYGIEGLTYNTHEWKELFQRNSMTDLINAYFVNK